MSFGEPIVPQAAVLIIADEPEFPPTVMARWQTERIVPAFRHHSSLQGGAEGEGECDLVILGPVQETRWPRLLDSWAAWGGPLLVVVRNEQEIERMRATCPQALMVREQEGWLDVLVALASEALRRVDAAQRARRAEQAVASAQGLATLGRFMLDMRHSISNALTSVLGNSELLLLEPGALSAEAREQVATIHNMAVRLHEILQRFSSLQNEMQVADRGSQDEARLVALAAQSDARSAIIIEAPAVPEGQRR